jgi:hypothetical protein
MMKKWMSSLFTLLLMITSSVFAANQASVVGSYKCMGYDPVYKHNYQTSLTIKPDLKSKQAFFVQERFMHHDAAKDIGIGYVYNNHFVSMFRDKAYGIGVVIYTIDGNGNLSKGEFLYYNHANKGVGRVSCTKL